MGDDEAARERFIALGEIAAEIAHELRNVLQVITASAYLARQDPTASAPHIAKIEKNARMAHAIVDDLMSLARGEAAHAEPVLVYDVIVAARQEIAPDAAVWVDDIAPHSLRVRAHAGLCTRLLHVLYENAIHASAPRAPTIATRASVTQDHLVLEIADDGPGVPPELAPRVFEPLVTGREGGSGLGLALARRIVAAHGGTVELAPSDRGACFCVTLPVRRG